MEHSELPTLYSVEPVHNEDIPFKTQNCEFFIDLNDNKSVQKNYAIKGFQTGIPIGQDVSNVLIVPHHQLKRCLRSIFFQNPNI